MSEILFRNLIFWCVAVCCISYLWRNSSPSSPSASHCQSRFTETWPFFVIYISSQPPNIFTPLHEVFLDSNRQSPLTEALFQITLQTLPMIMGGWPPPSLSLSLSNPPLARFGWIKIYLAYTSTSVALGPELVGVCMYIVQLWSLIG